MILLDATPMQSEHRYRGPGYYTANLLRAIVAGGLLDEIALLAQRLSPDDLPTLVALLATPSVRSVRLHRPRWPRYRLHFQLSSLAVRAALRSAHPELYHATTPAGLVVSDRTPSRSPVTVATLYDLIPLHDLDAQYPLRRLDQRLGYRRYIETLHRADRLIAISEATKRDAVQRLHIPPERIAVTPLAVDGDVFYPRTAAEVEMTRRRYGIARRYVLHVGASNRHKNTDNILRAFDLFVRRGGTDHELCIVGRWSTRELARVEATYGRLVVDGRLRVLGFVPDGDLPALYSGADAFVYPSLIEGFGLPVLEAMRCGCPVITSTASSLPEVAGDAALLVDPYDVEALAERLDRVARTSVLRQDLSTRGRLRAERFSWARTAAETLAVYKELL